ncbi:XRE family transcriptional regulator [Parvibaculum lavamentivorans]|nr:XRE family transcriptional regulator [Parvibaculum lavamentivorans]
MILNERELKEARAKISALNEALSSERALEPMVAGLPPEVVLQVTHALKAERKELTSSVEAYEQAKDDGNYKNMRQKAGGDPGLALIVARIARGLTQRDLAWRLGLKEQQVQRYEADRYSTISLKNYTKIALLLGVQLRADIQEFGGLDQVIENVSKQSIRKILSHGRQHGWFSEENDEQELRKLIAENRIDFGSPSLLRTGLNVKDYSEDILLHAWRARVSNRAQEIIDASRPEFEPLELTWLSDLVKLSVHEAGPLEAQNMLLQHGIILVVEPQIPGLAIDGAAFLQGDVPVIGMTIRKDSIDNFWFTLLHELAHVLLHYRMGLAVGFFDQIEAESVDAMEAEADAFASSILIPDELWRRSSARIAQSPTVIEKFAAELGIHASIVFGRIRKERNDYSIFSQKIGGKKVRTLFVSST